MDNLAVCRLVIVLWVLKVGSHAILPSEELSNTEKQLLQCVLGVASTHFNEGETVTVVPWEKEELNYLTGQSKVSKIKQTLVQQLVRSGNYTFWFNPKLKSVVETRETISGSAVVIVEEADTRKIVNYVLLVIRNLLLNDWDPRGKFVIVMLDNFGASRILAKNILSLAWRADVINAIAVVPSFFDLDVVDVYGWLPDHQQDLCYKILTSVTLLDRWVSSNFLYNNELFPSKLVQDMRGCTVGVFVFPVGNSIHFNNNLNTLGYAALSMTVISKVCNFNIYWFDSKDFSSIEHRLFDPRSYIKALYSVAYPRQGHQMYEFSYPVSKVVYTWLVPVGSPVPRWQGLIKIFSLQMWIFIPIAFFLLVIVLWMQGMTKNKISFTYCFLVVLRTHLAMGVPRVPRGRMLRFVFVLSLFYSLQVYTAYQSGLVSFLANPGRYPPIRNRDELQKSGIELTSFLFDMNYTAVSDIVTPHESVSMAVDSPSSLYRLMCVGDLAIATEVDFAENLIAHLQNYPCLSQYHYLEDSFHEGYYGYCFNRGSILFERFNTLLWRLQGSGLMNFWNYYFVHEQYFHTLDYDDTNVYVMTLSHLQGAFYLLTLGVSLSVLVFVVEVFYYSCSFRE